MNVFTRVTVQSLKKNKTRTVVTIVGILLATAMLTAVTTFVSSLQHFMIRAVVAESGRWHGVIYGVSQEEIGEIYQSEQVKTAASYQEMGYALLPKTVRPDRPYIFVAGMEKELYDLLPVNLVEGRLPQNSKEIAIPRMLVGQRHLSVKVGDTLTLNLGKRYFEGMERRMPDSAVLKEDETTLAEELVPKGERTYTVVGIIEQVGFEGYHSAGYTALTAIEEASGADSSFTCYFEMKKASEIYGFISEVQGSHVGATHSTLLRYLGVSGNRPFMEMLYGLAIILILLIMTGGISLVYNSFAISVSDRTRQFGLLSSVGATPRQMRGMVLKEAGLVSLFGIPLGVLSGIVGIGVTLKLIGRSFGYLYYSESANSLELHVSILAVVVAAFTAGLTVLISAWIPAKRASRMAPMDAIRQAKDIRVPKKVRRSGKYAYRLLGLPGMIAQKHFTRSKRQYRATIFSLFISIVLFISASSFSAYVRKSVWDVDELPDYDVVVYMGSERETELMSWLPERVSQMGNVEEKLETMEFYVPIRVDADQINEEYRELMFEEAVETDTLEGEGYTELQGILVVLRDQDYEAYLAELGLSGIVDARKQAVVLNQTRAFITKEQRYRIYNILKEAKGTAQAVFEDYVGFAESGLDKLEGEAYEEAYRSFQKPVEVSLGALVTKAPMGLFTNYGGRFGLVAPESLVLDLMGNPENYGGRWQMYLKSQEHQAVAQEIENLVLMEGIENGFFVMDATEGVQAQRSMLFTVDVFTYGFIALISLIAAANVFNSISTGFLLRRREFAVLSSVGMDARGMGQMLRFECVLYGCKSLLYGIPVSILVTYGIYRVVVSSMDTRFFIPVTSILIAICSVFAVVFATMLYAKGKLQKENLIDSIRRESV